MPADYAGEGGSMKIILLMLISQVAFAWSDGTNCHFANKETSYIYGRPNVKHWAGLTTDLPKGLKPNEWNGVNSRSIPAVANLEECTKAIATYKTTTVCPKSQAQRIADSQAKQVKSYAAIGVKFTPDTPAVNANPYNKGRTLGMRKRGRSVASAGNDGTVYEFVYWFDPAPTPHFSKLDCRGK